MKVLFEVKTHSIPKGSPADRVLNIFKESFWVSKEEEVTMTFSKSIIGIRSGPNIILPKDIVFKAARFINKEEADQALMDRNYTYVDALEDWLKDPETIKDGLYMIDYSQVPNNPYAKGADNNLIDDAF